ncbi:MAG: hypothetical protein MMC33_003705 [Icmadophila ericetorum]|nr:hypothetical protein [Icmadophila ericetorum]
MGTPEDGIQASLALIADAEANPQEDGEETNELELLMNWAEELRRDIEWLGNNGDHEYRAANKIAMERIRAERKAEKQAWRERHADEIEAELAKRRAEGNTDTGESLETLEVMGIARFSPLEDVED